MKWFNNLKVSRKFLAVGTFIFPLLILLSGTGIWGVLQVNTSLQDVRNNQIPAIYQIAGIIQHIQNSELQVAQLLLELDPHKASLQPDKIPNLIAAVRANISQAQKGWETYTTLNTSIEENSLAQQFSSDWKIWSAEAESLLQKIEQKIPDIQEIALSVFDELSSQNQNLEDTLLKIATINYNSTLVKADNGVNISHTVFLLVAATALLMLFLIFGVGFVLARSISRPLSNLKSVTQAIASGDLTLQVAVKTTDEVGELGSTFNRTLISLQLLVKQLHLQSQQISSATQELSSQAKSQVVGSSQQVSFINESVTSLQQLNQTAEEIMRQAANVSGIVEQSVRQAQSVSQLAENMVEAQIQGRANVAQTIEAIQNLKEELTTIETGQQTLVEHSSTIRGVIELIQSIAQETHLLALNAAIEAAGAGEYGDRFGVIAQEVKSLADRSVKATAEIRTALEGIAQLVADTSVQAKNSLREAEKAVKDSANSDNTLLALTNLSEQVKLAAHAIMKQVEVSANLAVNIATTTKQQQIASRNMLQQMTEIEAVTSQNLSSIQQEETAIYQLSLTAQDLLHSAEAFKLVNV